MPDISDRLGWAAAAHNEIIKLVETNGVMRFISPDMMPADRKAISYRPTLEINKLGAKRVRGAAGGHLRSEGLRAALSA